jgi:hypothetical protein
MPNKKKDKLEEKKPKEKKVREKKEKKPKEKKIKEKKEKKFLSESLVLNFD